MQNIANHWHYYNTSFPWTYLIEVIIGTEPVLSMDCETYWHTAMSRPTPEDSHHSSKHGWVILIVLLFLRCRIIRIHQNHYTQSFTYISVTAHSTKSTGSKRPLQAYVNNHCLVFNNLHNILPLCSLSVKNSFWRLKLRHSFFSPLFLWWICGCSPRDAFLYSS